jgi:hypothetical protein
LPPEPVQVNV